MNHHVRLAELNQSKKELEAELSHIRTRLKGGIDGLNRQTFHTRRAQIIDELTELEKEASDVRLAIHLGAAQEAEQKAAAAAVANPCLLVLMWDGRPVYYATRENVLEWQCEMLMELGQDAPVVLRVSSIPPVMVDKLPAWIWQTPDEREDESGPDAALPADEPTGCPS